MTIEIIRKYFVKFFNNKLKQNLFILSRAVSRVQTDGELVISSPRVYKFA
jgi:hypothetical protein